MSQLTNLIVMAFKPKETFEMPVLWLVEEDNPQCAAAPFGLKTSAQLIITGVDVKRDVFPTNYMAKGYRGEMHMKASSLFLSPLSASYLFTSPLPSLFLSVSAPSSN